MKSENQNTGKNQQNEVKGIRISRMNFVMCIIACVMFLLLTATVIHVTKTFRNTYAAIRDYVSCMQYGRDFLDSSDYLTDRVRLYSATGDPKYLEQYFSELDRARRENAIKDVEAYHMEAEAYDSIYSALRHSDQLKQQEIYAMSLLANAWDCDPSLIPQTVADTALSPDDLRLSPEEMIEAARDLVFGNDYQRQKQQIIDETQRFQDIIDAATKQRMEHDYSQLYRAMVVHQALIVIHFASTILGFIFSYVLVVRPMAGYVKHIKAREKLQVVGAYECQCLAWTCNTMFARNAAQEHTLRHQAEHDALTGLLNRGAFDNLRQTLHSQGEPMGLLIIDVDKFKQVNDSFGHEMGDRVLKQVASLLAGNFRSMDHPARIGGDEFSVILTNTDSDQQKAILEKIAAINHVLTHPADDLPAVSLSVGGAFSTEGFTDDLYRRADLALYAVKDHGRCGCRFYDDSLEKASPG